MYHRAVPQTYEIEAKTKAEAEEKCKQLEHGDFLLKKDPNY